MDQLEQTSVDESASTTLLTQKPPTIKKWALRPISRKHAAFLVGAFLAGMLFAFIWVIAYFLFFAADASPIATTPSSGNGAISAQISAAFVTELIQKNINNAGLPGNVQNVHVSFTHNGPLIVTGDMTMNIAGINTTRRLTVTLQPYISSCKVHVHVLHIDLQGFPLSVLGQTVENKINEQMQTNVSGLPTGFTYCATGVHTEPTGLFLTYSALAD